MNKIFKKLKKGFIQHHFFKNSGWNNLFGIKKNGAGFTLIELMVSLSIFVVIISSSSAVLIFTIRSQRKSFAQQELLNQTSYLIEKMSRAIRMARKDKEGICGLSVRNTNYYLTNDDTSIEFLNYNGVCQRFYFFENNTIMEDLDGRALPLTSTNLDVESFKVVIEHEEQTDTFQPKITFALKIKLGIEPNESQMNIQTTISQRNPDVQY